MYLIGNFIIQSDRYVYRMVLLEIGVYARVERGREGGGAVGLADVLVYENIT